MLILLLRARLPYRGGAALQAPGTFSASYLLRVTYISVSCEGQSEQAA